MSLHPIVKGIILVAAYVAFITLFSVADAIPGQQYIITVFGGACGACAIGGSIWWRRW